MSASYAAKNSYSAEGASLIRTKLVPIPPPAILEQRIKKLMEERQAAEVGRSIEVGDVSLHRVLGIELGSRDVAGH